MRVLLMDDEPLALRRLEILLSRRAWVEVAACHRDSASALDAIRKLRPDVVFLDVQMPGLDGFEVAEAIRAPDGPELVFVTAFDAYAVRAFDAAAADYLLKPVEPERLDEALARARGRLSARDAVARAQELETLVELLSAEEDSEGPEIWIRDRNGAVRIEKSRIDWVEAEGDYVRIHCGGRSWLMRATLSSMETRLDARTFARVHRSAIVNRRRISRVAVTETGSRRLELETGAEVPVGRAFESRIAELMQRPG